MAGVDAVSAAGGTGNSERDSGRRRLRHPVGRIEPRFGVMRIVNFAHGELVMYGMYAGVVASKNFGIDPLVILPLSFLLVALVGAAQYQIVFRHFVGHATLQQLLAAIGCVLVLQMIAQIIFGRCAHRHVHFHRTVRGVRAVLPVASADRRVHRGGRRDARGRVAVAADHLGQSGARRRR